MQFTTASNPGSQHITQRPFVFITAAGFLLFWALCFAGTTDVANWYIENLLVIIFSIVLLLTGRKFLFSDVSYCFIFLFLSLHIYGAKYAYADNPFGYWLERHFLGSRNDYDRIVHSSFGLLMSYPMRELFIRKFGTARRWSYILPVEVVLSLSAAFELVEWSIADVFFPEHGKNYVGTQGDVWDAQKDMFVATCGAIVAMVLLSILKAWQARTANANSYVLIKSK